MSITQMRTPYVVTVKQGQTLKRMTPDYHTRTKNGTQIAYVCHDRGENLFLSQKLPLLRDAINATVRETSDRVTVTALYNAVSGVSHTDGSKIKHNWSCTAYPLVDAVAVFSRMQSDYDSASVLTSKPCAVITG